MELVAPKSVIMRFFRWIAAYVVGYIVFHSFFAGQFFILEGLIFKTTSNVGFVKYAIFTLVLILFCNLLYFWLGLYIFNLAAMICPNPNRFSQTIAVLIAIVIVLTLILFWTGVVQFSWQYLYPKWKTLNEWVFSLFLLFELFLFPKFIYTMNHPEYGVSNMS